MIRFLVVANIFTSFVLCFFNAIISGKELLHCLNFNDLFSFYFVILFPS